MTLLTRLFVLLFAFFLAACYQEERTYTVNPDGSGKVVFEATFPLDSSMGISFGDEEEKKPEEKLKDAVISILEESEGVAAWSDVSFELKDGDKVGFKGTAYFKDLSSVDLNMGSISSDMLDPVVSRTGDLVTIECSQGDEEEDGDDQEKAAEEEAKKWEAMSEKEQDAELAKAKQQLVQMKAMVAGMAGDMSTKVTFLLPEAPSKNHNFEKVSDTSYTVESSGEKMLKAFDTLIEDEELLRSAAGGGIQMQGDPPEELFEALFGRPGQPSLVFSAKAAPAFDYSAEVKAAQEASPAMLKELGLEVVPVAPMAGEGSFESVRLAGLRVVTSSPDDSVRPFNWTKGISLALLGKLPGAVISAEEGEVKSFILDNDQDLLSSKKWDREIRSVDLSDDGTLVGFEIKSDKMPKAGATAIKELSGELVCMAATGSETVDLGFKKLAVGEEGERFKSKIEELGDHSFHEDKKEVSIRFEIDRSMIKEVHFVDPDGVRLESRKNGHSWSGKGGTLSFTVDKSLTEACRVEIETYSGVTKHVVPFKLENTPLMPVEAGE